MILQTEREQVVEYCIKLIEQNLTVGTFGNISVYNPKERLMAISPSGMDYYKTKPEDIVVLTPDGEKVDGDNKPSSEYDMHRIIYQRNEGDNAVIHTHSVWATTLACLGWEIEPVHYVLAYCGDKLPCIPYVQMGSYELAEAAHAAMGDKYDAVLLGNHGLLAKGGNIGYAFDVAQQMEFVAQLYYNYRIAGGDNLLSRDVMASVLDVFKDYRKR